VKRHQSHAEATYAPQTFKTFEGALYAFLEDECPQIGGGLIRQALAANLHGMVRRFFPSTSHLGAGQTVWPTVHKDAMGSYGKRIQDTELTPVTLDLVRPEDAADRAKGKRLRELKKEAVARLCEQADAQNGCLTSAELSILLKISMPTVGKYIAEWETERKTVLPRRGSIHDMGPTLTHKRIIIDKLFIEQKSVQQTARETFHSLHAIQRYISTFRQALMCRRKRMNTEETAFAIGRTVRLVKEYERIMDEYAERDYVLERLLNFEPHIESNPEKWANEYQGGK
jgi:hypothetical protein